MPQFNLCKWYLDCVTQEGDVSIGYTGTVQWGVFRSRYASLLESTGSKVHAASSLRGKDLPVVDGDSVRWRSEALDCSGEWRSDSAPVRVTVFSSNEGSVEWECLMPRATVKLQQRHGTGYVERLTMTAPPWKLPIHALLWGRFISATDWIVWIDWRGEFSRRVVFWNGNTQDLSGIEDDRLEFSDGATLLMDRSLTLREGPLGTAAFSGVPGLRKTFPARLLEINECKWRSRALLKRADGQTSEGWAIHERVVWPA